MQGVHLRAGVYICVYTHITFAIYIPCSVILNKHALHIYTLDIIMYT